MSSIDSFSYLFPYFNQKLRKCEQILSLIGLYFVCKLSSKLVYKILRFSFVHIWSQMRGNPLNGLKGWAVITFVSNGSGVSFARLLAQKRFDLILIDEREDVLRLIANQIWSEFRVEIQTIVIDVNNTSQMYDSIHTQIKDKDITVLINNVSLINQMTDNYMQFNCKQILSVLNKEIASVLVMTSMVLPEMERRKSGYIINISSVLAAAPIPYLSLHCASKAFVDRFSTALSYECRPKGIVIQSLMPSLCSQQSITGLIAPTHRTYAKSAFNTIGRTNRSTGYLWHELQYWFLQQFPQQFSPYFLNSFKSELSLNQTKNEFI